MCTCEKICESVWPPTASLYASSSCVQLRLFAGPFGQGFTNCGECNKQALLEIEKMSENNKMPPELLLLTPLPDVIHIGKSLKCSWSNWFIDLNGQMSNLVLICTSQLRDSTDSDIRKLLRKMLILECLRNKDRMAVEPIVRLTRPEVR